MKLTPQHLANMANREQQLSALLDDLIEFRAGVINPEMVSQVFGRGTALRDLRKIAGGVERVSPAVAAPSRMAPSMATGGVKWGGNGQSPLQRMFARNGINPAAVSTPAGAGSRGIGMATGAPPPTQAVKPQVAAAGAPPPGPPPRGPSTGGTAPSAAAAGAPTPPEKPPWWRRNVGKFTIGAGLGLAGAGAASAWMNSSDRNQQYSSRLKGTINLSDWLDGIITFQDRNPISGQFTPAGSGGPDPNAMATVYKLPQMQQQGPQVPQQGLTVGKAAAAALAGGALGQIGSQAGKAGYNKTAELIKQLAAKRKKKL